MSSSLIVVFVMGVVVGVAVGAAAMVLVSPGLVSPSASRRAQARLLERTVRSASAEFDAAAMRSAERLASLASTQLAAQLDVGSREIGHTGVAIGRQLDVMGGELERVGGLVNGLQRDRAMQHGELIAQLDSAARHGAELASTTRSLRDALNNSRARGQWGERLAEDVLRTAGFVEGTSYVRQRATVARTVPDFTFLLPDGLVLHMDVKFPIDNYLRYLEANAADQPSLAAAFSRDVRNRLKELNGRSYIEPGVTLDFVVAFIPNEAVFSFAHEMDSELVDVALGQQVVLCSPSTLFAVLGVVRRATDNFALDRRSNEILDCLAGLGSEWEKFTDAIDGLGRRLESTQTAFDAVAGPRRRQFQRRVDAMAHVPRQDQIRLTDAAYGADGTASPRV